MAVAACNRIESGSAYHYALEWLNSPSNKCGATVFRIATVSPVNRKLTARSASIQLLGRVDDLFPELFKRRQEGRLLLQADRMTLQCFPSHLRLVSIRIQ